MDIEVEKLLKQEQIDVTPKEILEQLFRLSEEKRKSYNMEEFRCINEIERTRDRDIPQMKKSLKIETNSKYRKGYEANINHKIRYINECIDTLNVIRSNRKKLKKNAIMMANVLGYDYKEE